MQAFGRKDYCRVALCVGLATLALPLGFSNAQAAERATGLQNSCPQCEHRSADRPSLHDPCGKACRGVGCARRLLVLPLLLIPPLVSFLHCSVLPEMLFASGSWPIDQDCNRWRLPAAKATGRCNNFPQRTTPPGPRNFMRNDQTAVIICGIMPPSHKSPGRRKPGFPKNPSFSNPPNT